MRYNTTVSSRNRNRNTHTASNSINAVYICACNTGVARSLRDIGQTPDPSSTINEQATMLC